MPINNGIVEGRMATLKFDTIQNMHRTFHLDMIIVLNQSLQLASALKVSNYQ